jgi:hypothetical protein
MDYDIFREELGSKYHSLGHALWQPSPGEFYDFVRVGDVGAILKGRFHRFFNALLPEGHPSQSSRLPEHHQPLQVNKEPHIFTTTPCPTDFYSWGVTAGSDGRGIRASE